MIEEENQSTEEGGTTIIVTTNKDEKSLSEAALEEVTKATISQSIGTLIYPVTREIAQLEEVGIKKLKKAIRNRKKRKLAEANRESIKRIEKKVGEDPSKAEVVEKLHDLVDEASEHELDNEDLFKLWGSLIHRLEHEDKDYDLLLGKLKSLNSAETEFLLKFKKDRYNSVDVNVFFRVFRFNSHNENGDQRAEQIALSLKDKGILEQPFSMIRAVFALLAPIVFFLILAEVLRPVLSINVSSANIVILLGVVGILMGFSLLTLTTLKKPTQLTWVGKKLLDGAPDHYDEDKI